MPALWIRATVIERLLEPRRKDSWDHPLTRARPTWRPRSFGESLCSQQEARKQRLDVAAAAAAPVAAATASSTTSALLQIRLEDGRVLRNEFQASQTLADGAYGTEKQDVSRGCRHFLLLPCLPCLRATC